MDAPDVLTPEEIATALRKTRRTVYRWLTSGKLRAVKAGRSWRVYRSDLEVFLDPKLARRERDRRARARSAQRRRAEESGSSPRPQPDTGGLPMSSSEQSTVPSPADLVETSAAAVESFLRSIVAVAGAGSAADRAVYAARLEQFADAVGALARNLRNLESADA